LSPYFSRFLTPQLEGMMRQKVTSGRYISASEVVREALRRMDEKDRLRTAKLAQSRQDIQESLDSGPVTTWDPTEMKCEGLAQKSTKTRTVKTEMPVVLRRPCACDDIGS
jgi:antitoxin ParD1/3/4